MAVDRGSRPKTAIFGCAGPVLSDAERRFFRDVNPLGFILFARNCVDPDQVRALVDSFRDAVERADAPVLIDQEGGRVARLRPPHWRAAPAPGRIAPLADRDPERAVEATWLNTYLIAADLADLGITFDCAPVLDIPQPDSDEQVLGDRATGRDAAEAIVLGCAACEGFLDGGVLPIIKHIPGHGRATVDSHDGLPRVEVPLEHLEMVDFAPFVALREMPWAMTCHVVYTAIDAEAPATLSSRVVRDIIRGHIGFKGVLVTDDLSMGALSGGLDDRARGALAAGCDLALHCNGDMEEMAAVASVCGPLSDETMARLVAAEEHRRVPVNLDRKAATAILGEMLESA